MPPAVVAIIVDSSGTVLEWRNRGTSIMDQPRIAFATTVKGRTPHLKLTLPKNLADNAAYANCVFVILDYGSDDDLLEYLKTSHAADIASGRVVVYSYAY